MPEKKRTQHVVAVLYSTKKPCTGSRAFQQYMRGEVEASFVLELLEDQWPDAIKARNIINRRKP